MPKALRWTLWNKKEADAEMAKIERFKALITAWLVLDNWCVFCCTILHDLTIFNRLRDIAQQQQTNHEREFL